MPYPRLPIFRLSIWCIILLFGFSLAAQKSGTDKLYLDATILDANTKEPIPYASVYIKEKGRGTISDISGHFELDDISITDTIRISFIGYTERAFTLSKSVAGGVYFLQPKLELLNEITVYSSNEYLYKLVRQVSKTRTYKADTAKSYYNLRSQVNGKLVELLECYYNGVYAGYDVNTLNLKNGRIALDHFDDRYFISSETSRVMYLHKLFDESDFLPNNPLSYGKGKLSRYYDLKLVSKYAEGDSALIYVINYTPKKDENEHFSGTLWIDSVSNTLHKITLEIKDAGVHPFIPHGYTDSLMQIDLNISRTYEQEKQHMSVKSIDFDYELTYKTRDGKQYSSKTRAVLYAYNYQSQFKLPFFNFSESTFVDYRKISAAPYNEFFWQNRDEFGMAKDRKEKERFINHQSSLTSRTLFSDKAFYGKSFFEQPYIFWDPKRVVFREEDYDPSKYVSTIPTDRYKLTAQIYLDINQAGDSTNYITSTVFDPFESYYHYPASSEGQAFINMYFDIVEIYRRKLNKELKASPNLTSSIDSIYMQNQQQLEATTDQFLKDVDHGTNKNEMTKWNAYVLERLQINNLSIFGISTP